MVTDESTSSDQSDVWCVKIHRDVYWQTNYLNIKCVACLNIQQGQTFFVYGENLHHLAKALRTTTQPEAT